MRRTGLSLWGAMLGLLYLLPVPSADAVVFRGLSLNDMMSTYGFGPPNEYGRNAVYRNRLSTIVVEAGNRRVVLNGMSIYLNRSIGKVPGDWLIAPVDAADTLGAILFPARALRKVGCATVVLDPGHGGADPGTTGVGGMREKALTLDIARRVRTKLRECQLSVWLTRDRDDTMTLDERCWRGRKLGADVFVSIHFNASRSGAIAGVETYIVPAAGYPTTADVERQRVGTRVAPCPGNQFDGANAVLAHFLHKGLLSQTRADDRGIRRARFYVIRNAGSPAALVECGFVSNGREAARIADGAYRDRIAEGIARGILTYLNRVREPRLPPSRGL